MIQTHRIIDTVAHSYTGRQLLDRLLVLWRESTEQPVCILTLYGEAEWKVNAIRVALSKERNKQRIGSHYGMETSRPFMWTYRTGQKAEAIIIRWRQSQFQNLSLLWDTHIIGRNRNVQ